jgi:arylsulfatase A-like enzyme
MKRGLLTAAVLWVMSVLGRAPAARGAEAEQARPADRPNIVIIVADDLGWADVGWHDGPYQTPHLDRLCREGLELDQHYVSPMCSPTRAALLSGRYASRFGCTGAQNERVFPFGTPTLASLLREAGYTTALIGKWHLGSTAEWGPQHFGFDYSYGSLAGGCGPFDHKYKKGPYTDTWHRNGQPLDEAGHITDLIAEDAVAWIGRQGDQPFFLYVPFTAVHIPIKEPREWLERYPEIEQPDRRQYAACVTHLDDAVVRIVAALDQMGRRENTVILFFSDNGGTQARNDDPLYPGDDYPSGRAHGSNLPLRGNKTQLYEGGVRVTSWIYWPGKLPSGKFAHPLHAVDWMPTFCALAGATAPQDSQWDGRNVWPWLAGDEPPAPRAIYWAGTGFRSAAVRDGDWKLILDRRDQSVELFNLAADLREQSDLAQEHPDRVATLKALLDRLSAKDQPKN